MKTSRLSGREIEHLGHALGAVTEAPAGVAPTARAAVMALKELIPCDSIVFGYRRASDGVYFGFAQPDDYPVERYGPVYQHFLSEHPVVEHFNRFPRSGAVRLTDIVGRPLLERRGIYQEFFRPLGIHQLLGRVIPIPELAEWSFGPDDGAFSYPQTPSPYSQAVIAIGLARDRGSFSDAEVALLDLFSTAATGQFMRELRWELSHRQLQRSYPDPLGALQVLSQGQAPSQLERVASASTLTKRETEVLRWLAEGKTNPEIGVILTLSPRTVQSHVIAILGKLGVENRLAAARMVWCAPGRGSPP